jgi:hypothetical protein
MAAWSILPSSRNGSKMLRCQGGVIWGASPLARSHLARVVPTHDLHVAVWINQRRTNPPTARTELSSCFSGFRIGASVVNADAR